MGETTCGEMTQPRQVKNHEVKYKIPPRELENFSLLYNRRGIQRLPYVASLLPIALELERHGVDAILMLSERLKAIQEAERTTSCGDSGDSGVVAEAPHE